MKLNELKEKNILILGYGKEGKDTYLALKTLFPKKKITIADRNKVVQKGSKIIYGKDYLKILDQYDVIIKTPGIPIKKLKTKSVITTQTQIFFDNFKGLIIGVTGTKGKGTVSSLIYNILKEANIRVSLVGNIGTPVFKKLLKSNENDIFVYELSSHQLQSLKKSPQIAIFLNLFPDHLDYYKDIKEYQKAKENIFKYQTKNDFLITNLKVNSKSTIIPIKGKLVTQKSSLRGEFNQFNILAAQKTVELLKIKESVIKKGIENFKGLPHRLEYIGKHAGIDFYNDSMSTIPEVSLAAILSVKPDTVIVGGSDKGSNYNQLNKEIKKIKNIIILGEGTGDKITKGIKNKTKVYSMKEAVKQAYKNKGKVCLLSPGSASFNMFSDYKERGNLFKKWVKYYGKKN